MRSILLLMLLSFLCLKSNSQKKYGYTVLHFRCGDNDATRDRVYYSPVIELNTLNFPQYTDGIDPAIAPYSVRYFNYAISKWFEIYLRNKYRVLINDIDKYARKSTSVIYNSKNKNTCNDEKTNTGCFFISKEELMLQRKNAIQEDRSPENSSTICEVINL